MDDDIKKRTLYPSLSGNPKVRVSYGDKNLTKIIESLILLDIDEHTIVERLKPTRKHFTRQK